MERGQPAVTAGRVVVAGGRGTKGDFKALEELADLPFVGMDCVEVAPPYDHAELTSYAAASFVPATGQMAAPAKIGSFSSALRSGRPEASLKSLGSSMVMTGICLYMPL